MESKTTHCFLFFCTSTQFLLEHPSLGIIEFVLPLQPSLVRAPSEANWRQICFSCGFYSDYKKYLRFKKRPHFN